MKTSRDAMLQIFWRDIVWASRFTAFYLFNCWGKFSGGERHRQEIFRERFPIEIVSYFACSSRSLSVFFKVLLVKSLRASEFAIMEHLRAGDLRPERRLKVFQAI